MRLAIKPIGVVKHSYPDEYIRNSIKGVKGFIEIFDEYSAGLRGIDGFSHIIVLAYLDRVGEESRKTLLVKPRGLARKTGFPLDKLPLVGVFATDSPHRPNPIALTIVKLLEVRGRVLLVEGLDLYNETPVIDIKPYTPSRRVKVLSLPEWYRRIVQTAKRARLDEEV